MRYECFFSCKDEKWQWWMLKELITTWKEENLDHGLTIFISHGLAKKLLQSLAFLASANCFLTVSSRHFETYSKGSYPLPNVKLTLHLEAKIYLTQFLKWCSQTCDEFKIEIVIRCLSLFDLKLPRHEIVDMNQDLFFAKVNRELSAFSVRSLTSWKVCVTVKKKIKSNGIIAFWNCLRGNVTLSFVSSIVDVSDGCQCCFYFSG